MDLIAQLPSSTSRFKFCWLNNQLNKFKAESLAEHKIPVFNVGKMVARSINSADEGTNLSWYVTQKLSKELEKEATQIKKYDYPIVGIYNIGIVKEPALKINFENLLTNICRSICVILIWDDKYENGKFVVESDYNSQEYLSFNQPITELSF